MAHGDFCAFKLCKFKVDERFAANQWIVCK